jgi:hypothetical protein
MWGPADHLVGNHLAEFLVLEVVGIDLDRLAFRSIITAFLNSPISFFFFVSTKITIGLKRLDRRAQKWVSVLERLVDVAAVQA